MESKLHLESENIAEKYKNKIKDKTMATTYYVKVNIESVGTVYKADKNQGVTK